MHDLFLYRFQVVLRGVLGQEVVGAPGVVRSMPRRPPEGNRELHEVNTACVWPHEWSKLNKKGWTTMSMGASFHGWLVPQEGEDRTMVSVAFERLLMGDQITPLGMLIPR